MAARQAVQSNELLRRAYKYIARNTTLPSRVRHMAQLELNAFPNKSRPAAAAVSLQSSVSAEYVRRPLVG